MKFMRKKTARLLLAQVKNIDHAIGQLDKEIDLLEGCAELYNLREDIIWFRNHLCQATEGFEHRIADAKEELGEP